MTTAMKIAWGPAELVPEGAPAAWGARAIVQGTYLDVPWDRTSQVGSVDGKFALIAKLREVDPIEKAEAKLVALHLRPSDDPVDIYSDDEFVVRGVLRGGYFYLAAWLKGEQT